MNRRPVRKRLFGGTCDFGVYKGERIVVALGRNTLYAFDPKIPGGPWMSAECTFGRPGNRTPPGIYKVIDKVEDYHSKKYNAPMHFSLFFDRDGKAIHASAWVFGRAILQGLRIIEGMGVAVGSHGCIGLSGGDAEKLFRWAPGGTTVEVGDEPPGLPPITPPGSSSNPFDR